MTPSMWEALTVGIVACGAGVVVLFGVAYLAEVFWYAPRRKRGGR